MGSGGLLGPPPTGYSGPMVACSLHGRVLAVANQLAPRATPKATLHRYVVREKETVRNFVAPAPSLGIVLEGRKTVWRGGSREVFAAGRLLLMPADVALDVTNEPDAESGVYRAMLLEFSPAVMERFRSAYPHAPHHRENETRLGVDLDDRFAEALLHVLESLAIPEDFGCWLSEHRLMEVLFHLRRRGHLPDLLGLSSGGDPVDRVRELIRLDPSSEWTAERVAPMLGMSVATLGRRLREAGGLRRLLEEERMSRAMHLIERGNISVSELATACGYASPARFAVRFRAHHGKAPSDLLRS